jgi:hypothetical protein
VVVLEYEPLTMSKLIKDKSTSSSTGCVESKNLLLGALPWKRSLNYIDFNILEYMNDMVDLEIQNIFVSSGLISWKNCHSISTSAL